MRSRIMAGGGPLGALLGVAVVAAPVFGMLRSASVGRFSGHLQLFDAGMVSPFLLMLPLATGVIVCRDLSQELRYRFISLRRCRSDIRSHLMSRMAAALRTGFILGFLCSGISYVIAFHVWPLLGDPRVDPAYYALTPAEETSQSLGAVSFSHLLAFGDWVYGVSYSAWLGFCVAVYAGAGMTALLFVRNRFLAPAMPMLIVFLQTLAAAYAGQPQYGLYYSALPFALTASSDLVTATSTIVLAASVVVFAVVAILRAPRSGRLM